MSWLRRNRKDLIPPRTMADEERAKIGTALGELARARFEGGTLISPAGSREEHAALTQAAVDRRQGPIFEGTFIADGCLARVDVLEPVEGGWRIIEVKSSKEAKEEQLQDLFFQVHVLRRAGIEIQEACLGLINGEYKFDGIAHDPLQLFRVENFSNQESVVLPQILAWLEVAREALADGSEPFVVLDRKCWRPDKCSFQGHCLADQPKPSIYTLPQLHPSREKKLIEFGIRGVAEIEDPALLTDRQIRYWRAIREQKMSASPDLMPRLDEIKFPALFLDFEAVSPALPLFKGSRPYEIVHFQWSAHLLTDPEMRPDEWEHYEFLGHGDRDPRPAFCSEMESLLERSATVVHYSPYELTQLKKLTEMGVERAGECLDLFRKNPVDLEDIVKQTVDHPAFEGKTSIKKVLPALVPGLDYSDLEIGNGDAAQLAFLKFFEPDLDPAFRTALRLNLLAYCKRDTEAMVRLYQALRNVA